jgi:hypothetical protein
LPPRSGLERSDFVHWHVWDMPTDAGNVCFLGYFGSPVSGSSARRAGWSRRRNPPSCRFITADHDPPYALDPIAKGAIVFVGAAALSWGIVVALRRVPVIARVI